jgi:tetratricopeptide (TPR) repeat protein
MRRFPKTRVRGIDEDVDSRGMGCRLPGADTHADTGRRAASDAEDKTEKHPVTPGPLAPARELYGAMLLERGKPKEALAAFEATLKKEPHRLGATIGAAKAAEKLDDAAQAQKYYAAVVALAENADPVRPDIAQARAFVAKR